MTEKPIAFSQVSPEKRREDLMKYAVDLRALADELESGNNSSLIVASADAAGIPTTMVLGPRVVNLGLLKHLENIYSRSPRERAAIELYESLEYEQSLAEAGESEHPDDWSLAVPIEEYTEEIQNLQREKTAEYLHKFADEVAGGKVAGLVLEAANQHGELLNIRYGPSILAYGLIEALREEPPTT
jgi:hypothetical protein